MYSTIKQKLKICKRCNFPKPIFSHGLCVDCAKRNYAPIKRSTTQLKRSPIKKKYKPTGELIMFREIWAERPHVCEKCGDSIHEFSHDNFHHVKRKGKYPELRLVKSNVVINCFDCHYAAHFGNSIVPLD